jgi:hypothetical protein
MFLRHCSSSKLPGSPSSCFRFGAYRLPSGTVSPAGRQAWATTRGQAGRTSKQTVPSGDPPDRLDASPWERLVVLGPVRRAVAARRRLLIPAQIPRVPTRGPPLEGYANNAELFRKRP